MVVLMYVQVYGAAGRGDLAVVRSLIEEQARDVNEKDGVRYLWLWCHLSIDALTHAYICVCISMETLH